MMLKPITFPSGFDPLAPIAPHEPSPQAGGFASSLTEALSSADQLMKSADAKVTDIALGKSENLHGAMIEFNKADSALKLIVQLRNKALEAYHEILRMQV